MFNTPTHIALSVDERNGRSVLELTAGDRPGLLCDVGKVLMHEHVELHAAKIMTVGERAEDVFYLTDFGNRPLAEDAAERLRAHLTGALDRQQAALRAPAAATLQPEVPG
jgi:[protein-PII] uridylyltransferase